MSVEGLWSLTFKGTGVQGQEDYGAGVVIFESCKLFGGDSAYFYLGDYDVHNDTLNANVKVVNYVHGIPNVFGLDENEYELDVVAQVPSSEKVGCSVRGAGTVKGHPNLQIQVILTKRADLP